MEDRVWISVDEYYYPMKVSNMGEGMYFFNNDWHIYKPIKIGYYHSFFIKPKIGYKYYIRVHTLVATAFHGNNYVKGKVIANHIDNDKLNNKADNLEWVTYSENRWISNYNKVNKTCLSVRDAKILGIPKPYKATTIIEETIQKPN